MNIDIINCRYIYVNFKRVASDEKYNMLFVNINTTGCPLSNLYMQVKLERSTGIRT